MKNRICIGILGGGQLARMSAYQAYKLGYDVSILDKERNSPAGQLTKKEFTGWVDDEEILTKFAESADIITLENEFIDHSKLQFLEGLGKTVIPTSNTISLIQDKFIQKTTLRKAGIAVPDFYSAEDKSYKDLKDLLGRKFILKSRTMGYDGYGNALVNSEASFETAKEKLTSRKSLLYAEKVINFSLELAVMVVRTKKEIKVYPVVQTIQKNHICHMVIAPAEEPMFAFYTRHEIEKLKKQTQEIAVESVKAVKGFGLYGIEMFLDAKSNLLVNEIAPRPHNSGHFTIEGCITSQFENHIRSILNLPLGSTKMVYPFAVMINILGKQNGTGFPENYSKSLKLENVHYHIYGKKESRPGRKMGHLTVTGGNLDQVLICAKEAAALIKI